MRKKLLVVQVAALSSDFSWDALDFRPIQSVFPALTCTVQGSFRTAAPPRSHGMIANGRMFRDLGRPIFWEQSAALVEGERIWDDLRGRGGKVGMMFWQQSLGERVDLLLSPAPVHRHNGGLIQDCYGRPNGLYAKLCDAVGEPFSLMRYWGPLASAKVGDWIAAATAAVMADRRLAPDLLLTYLPSLDYAFQRYGPKHLRSQPAVRRTLRQLRGLLKIARQTDYDLLVFGDYAIGASPRGAVLPNVALAETNLLKTRSLDGMLYPDFHGSAVFAVADHEVAHVYVKRPEDIERAREVLAATPGVGQLLDRDAQRTLELDHPNSGELVLVAEEGAWFAYPWWTRRREAPDYATHVDIHNKPGYDPCELFFGWPPGTITRKTDRVRGSHGRVGADRKVAWGATFPLGKRPASLIELARAVRDYINEA